MSDESDIVTSGSSDRMRRKRERDRYDEELAARDLVRVEEIVHRHDEKALRFSAARLRDASKVTLPNA